MFSLNGENKKSMKEKYMILNEREKHGNNMLNS